MTKIELNGGLDFVVYETRGGSTTEIVDIVVKTERERGIGTRLVNQIINGLTPPHNLYVLTRRTNGIATKFYFSLGFKYLATLPNFYLDDNTYCDAVLLMRTIM